MRAKIVDLETNVVDDEDIFELWYNRLCHMSEVSTAKETRYTRVVYSDVRGPFNTRTLGGSLYFVTFIDIHSRNI